MGPEIVFFGRCADSAEDAGGAVNAPLKADVWSHFSLVVGAKDSLGKRGIAVVQDASYDFDFADWLWCAPPNGGDPEDFFQAISSTENVLISPIEFEARALSQKEVQNQVYQEKSRFRPRRGPLKVDSARLESKITHDRFSYTNPGVLVSPPILLQKRTDKSIECSTQLGSVFQQHVWDGAVGGTMCDDPFACPSDLLESSLSLLSCTNDQSPSTFMQQPPLNFKGKGLVFAEFLTTIADAELLLRGEGSEKEAILTSNFLDSQTSEITVLLVLYAPDVGIATKISISGAFSTSVLMDFNMQHIQTLEGPLLTEYTVITVFAIIMALVLCVERVLTARGAQKINNDYMKDGGRLFLIFDLVMLVLLPIIYLVIRLAQHTASKTKIFDVIGPNG